MHNRCLDTFTVTFPSFKNDKCYTCCLQTVQEIVNIQPNLTKSSGSCDSDSASLQIKVDAEKTILTLFFTLVMKPFALHPISLLSILS